MAQLHDSISGKHHFHVDETGEEVPNHWPRRGEMDSRRALHLVQVLCVLMIIALGGLIAYMVRGTLWHAPASSRWLEHAHDR